MVQVTQVMLAVGDPGQRLANATVHLGAFVHSLPAWIWPDQALVCGGFRRLFHQAERNACRFFFIDFP